MAIQSATLLCGQLIARPEVRSDRARSGQALEGIRHEYAMAWRSNFSRRLYVAALFAHLFMRPVSTRIAVTIAEALPATPDRGRALERQGGAVASRAINSAWHGQ